MPSDWQNVEIEDRGDVIVTLQYSADWDRFRKRVYEKKTEFSGSPTKCYFDPEEQQEE